MKDIIDEMREDVNKIMKELVQSMKVAADKFVVDLTAAEMKYEASALKRSERFNEGVNSLLSTFEGQKPSSQEQQITHEEAKPNGEEGALQYTAAAE